jgi:hypothetical protein
MAVRCWPEDTVNVTGFDRVEAGALMNAEIQSTAAPMDIAVNKQKRAEIRIVIFNFLWDFPGDTGADDSDFGLLMVCWESFNPVCILLC